MNVVKCACMGISDKEKKAREGDLAVFFLQRWGACVCAFSEIFLNGIQIVDLIYYMLFFCLSF